MRVFRMINPHTAAALSIAAIVGRRRPFVVRLLGASAPAGTFAAATPNEAEEHAAERLAADRSLFGAVVRFEDGAAVSRVLPG